MSNENKVQTVTARTTNGRFNEQTTWEDIVNYVDKVLENPIILELTDHTTKTNKKIYVYNFNTHKIDFKSLKRFVQKTPYEGVFIIPHSMSAAWAFMLQYLLSKGTFDNAVYLNYRVSKYLPVFSPEISKNIFKLIPKE